MLFFFSYSGRVFPGIMQRSSAGLRGEFQGRAGLGQGPTLTVAQAWFSRTVPPLGMTMPRLKCPMPFCNLRNRHAHEGHCPVTRSE